MKKRLVELFQVVVAILFLCSCISIGQPAKKTENNNPKVSATDSGKVVSSNTETMQPIAAKVDTLSVNNCEYKAGNGAYDYVVFTIQNNSETILHTITINIFFLDSEDNIINSTYPQTPNRLRPGQSTKIEAIYAKDPKLTYVYVDSFSYYDEKDNYHQFYVSDPVSIYELSALAGITEEHTDVQSSSSEQKIQEAKSNVETASPEPTNKRNTTKSVYYSAITLTKRDLEKHYTDKGIRYYYRGIPLSDKENEFINAKYNKSGAVNQTAMYEAMAELLSGFGLGRASGNNWDSYAEVLIGYTPLTRDQMIPYVKNAVEFIVPSDKASEVASAIMHKIETIPEASGKFDYKNGAYEVEISDLSKCADHMMISEEMLGYILAELNAMGAEISFDKNACSISLTIKTWGSLF